MTRRWLLSLALAAAIAGCQAPPVAPDAVGWVRPGDEAVHVGAPVPPNAMRFVRFADAWQREDYGSLNRDGVTAEIVFLAADPRTTVALDFRMPTRDALSSFTAIASARATWEPAEPVPGWHRQLFYRPFTLADPARACVGFAGAWGLIAEDPEQRPRHALFGYLCQPAGTPMSRQAVAAIVRSIRVDPKAVWRASEVGPAGRADTALATARGTVEFGNPSYPFRLARFYVVGNGRSGFK